METIEQHALRICDNNQQLLDLAKKRNRKPETISIRFKVCYELKQIGFTLQDIGKFFGYADHFGPSKAIKRAIELQERREFENRVKKHIKL